MPLSPPITSSSVLPPETTTDSPVIVTTTPAPSKNPVPTTVAAETFGDLASAGRLYYANYCMGCHGADGQGQNGPPLWKPAGILGKRDNAVFFDNNAQAMLDFIKAFMPIGWYKLSPVQYMDITAYILVQDSQVSLFDLFDPAQLKNIILRQ
jgi:mono/diheme cytochrome c family protein